ncbi:helix-turn-helix domain-containing protein [Alphaproteobacteria bacterium]|nr:helix-turn-helix domain-containing protein [Alphaproteobacteria bacterium]MDB9824730.1 helix-turn-helix domain-containing protein [Alphaproteobacteria bacterium]
MNCFKSKRLEFSISIEEAAEKISISPYVLEDLENDNYQAIPQPFIYYCAKHYADFLEIELPKIIKRARPIV